MKKDWTSVNGGLSALINCGKCIMLTQRAASEEPGVGIQERCPLHGFPKYYNYSKT